MEALRVWLHHLFSIYLSITTAVLQCLLIPLPKLRRFPFFVPVVESILNFYFRFHDLSPCTVDLDDQTSIHFWAPTHRRFDKPNLVIVHGYGGNAKWQFVYQLGALAQSFNIFVPDLLFFGDSQTRRADRSVEFQGRCLWEGLRGLGVRRCSMYGISYGGFVVHRMAGMYPELLEKVVIVSSGIGFTDEQKREHLTKIGRDAQDLLLPNKPDDLRLLAFFSIHKFNPFKGVPDMILQEFINIMCNANRKGKQELLEHLLEDEADRTLQTLHQETLLIWGDRDRVFPVTYAIELQRRLGPNVKLEVIPNTGHAVNIDSPDQLNALIKAFVICTSNNVDLSGKINAVK